MLTLPPILRKNGFTYTQVLRGGRSCIYRQDVTPKIKQFEVFLIKVKPEREIFGTLYPEKEVFPSDEDFGVTAWSCKTYERAFELYLRLEEARNV